MTACLSARGSARLAKMTEGTKKASKKFSECGVPFAPSFIPLSVRPSQPLCICFFSFSFLFLFLSIAGSLWRTLILSFHGAISPSLWPNLSLPAGLALHLRFSLVCLCPSLFLCLSLPNCQSLHSSVCPLAPFDLRAGPGKTSTHSTACLCAGSHGGLRLGVAGQGRGCVPWVNVPRPHQQ